VSQLGRFHLVEMFTMLARVFDLCGSRFTVKRVAFMIAVERRLSNSLR